ncbi:MAG: tRNA 2-selenouridine(34) synthase MnmH [Rhodobacteraceae bacterium]|nr:tRNA 2-selenouridine(34) synthase MnmH [Paracoccaceae bacterium]
MSFVPDTLGSFFAHGFDTVIDVRAPAEFAEDHVPGAINLPALTDAERARVGTIYKQVSPFSARKIGAALVARNVAAHLDGPLSDKDGGWRPLVYCWRGGQRSGSVATILREVGWRVETVPGGYKTYRSLVVDLLHVSPVSARLVLLDGHTGTAKTEVLARLSALGCQVIDLEALAHHRGSYLGAHIDAQPSQKTFESGLARALWACDPTRPIIVEAESSKIGDLLIPTSFWKSMLDAPRIRIDAPVAARSEYLTRAYRDLIADPDALVAALERLVPIQGHARVNDWVALAQSGAFVELASELTRHHYDPRYEAAAKARDVRYARVFDCNALDTKTLDGLAGKIADWINAQ